MSVSIYGHIYFIWYYKDCSVVGISKIKMRLKSLNKWEEYITEVRPELFSKLNEYTCIDNFGEIKIIRLLAYERMVLIKIYFKK